jgi:ATP/maltotriose-dependent transcriptional regulator MalT
MPLNTILKTKFFRPKPPADFVNRSRLHEKLDNGAHCRLSLVSAAAGYGKSLLVSSWLESCDRPNVWLSLDEEISDLSTFLHYFLFAVRELFPDACPNTLAILSAPDLQSPQMLSAELINELSEIRTPFVLVLDDYGFIHDPMIHELLNQVLKHLPPALQLLVLTRRDPPFSLHSLRAHGDLVEIRQKDLQFTMEEMAVFLNTTIGLAIDEPSQAYLHERIEGWAVGLRLMALSLQNRDDVGEFLREMKGDTRHIQDYLMAEVLSRQSSTMREGLLKTSILARFCAPLCKALCHPSCEDLCGAGCDGTTFMRKLEESNLFCIVLDEQHEWFRYHHLFQQLLQRTLESRYSSDEIARLHDLARTWFEENRMIEEAFHHAMLSSDPVFAGKLIARHRHELMNKEQWHRLGRLLDKLPRTVIENNPELLIQDAWVLWNRMQIREMVKVLDQVELLLAAMPADSRLTREMQGEVDAMRSLQYYLVPPCDATRALAHAQKAMENNPPHHSSTRGMAVIMLAMSYQLTGNLTDAFGTIFEELKAKEAHQTTYHTRLLITLCFLYWVEVDLGNMKQTGQDLLKLGKELHLSESSHLGQYFSGLNHYCRNELGEAEKSLTDAVRTRDKVNIFNFAHSSFVLALVKHEQGDPDKAYEIAESVVHYGLDTGNASLLQLAHAFQAELALRQGKIAEAVKWTKSYQPEPFATAHRFYVPQLSLARILLAQNTPTSRQQATDLLSRLHDFYDSIHNSYCLINILAMQAVLYSTLGEGASANKKLGQGLSLAEAGGFIRLFLDLGSDMEKLLLRQEAKSHASDYIRKLLHAFEQDRCNNNGESILKFTTETTTKASASMPNPLTLREQEIIELLSKRLSNQEIADRLFISRETAKRHIANMYKKLMVKNRRQAVDQAISQGILS